MKAIKQVMKKDQEQYRVPKRVQDVIPIKCMWSDGIFLVGTRYSKTFKFTDIKATLHKYRNPHYTIGAK